MEFVKLLNVGRFHSSIYHRLLHAIVSLVSDLVTYSSSLLIILQCLMLLLLSL